MTHYVKSIYTGQIYKVDFEISENYIGYVEVTRDEYLEYYKTRGIKVD